MQHIDTLRHYWFPLCKSTELKQRPLAQTLLGEPLVLFRSADGRVAALADRCPHRNVPLSAGWVRDSLLVCPYHGWRFDDSGTCRAVPGLCGEPNHPTRSVPTHKVVEQNGLVWASLDPQVPPPMEQPRQPGNTEVIREFSMNAALMDALENFLDGTHTHFVHAGLVRREGVRRRVTAIVRGSHDCVEAEYVGEEQQSGLVSRLFGADVNTSLGRFILPATVQLEYRSAQQTRLLITLYFTPESDSALRVFAVATGRTAPLPAGLVVGPLSLILQMVVRQDRRILALQLANKNRFGGEHYTSTELDVLRPHIARLLRRGASEEKPIEPFERRVVMML